MNITEAKQFSAMRVELLSLRSDLEALCTAVENLTEAVTNILSPPSISSTNDVALTTKRKPGRPRKNG